MYRSTHPFRSALVRPRRTTRATRERTRFTFDLATWLNRLAPANRSLPAPEADQPAEPQPTIGALPWSLAERKRAAA